MLDMFSLQTVGEVKDEVSTGVASIRSQSPKIGILGGSTFADTIQQNQMHTVHKHTKRLEVGS